MAGRRHLRSRVFLMTACNAAMLLLIAFVLTSRAKEAQRSVDQLIRVDIRATDLLGELIRNQNAFHSRFHAASAEGTLAALAPRYRSVVQLMDGDFAARGDFILLIREVGRYNTRQRAAAARWPILTEEERGAALAELDSLSARILREAASLTRYYQSEIDRELPALQRRANGMMWTALGITWIIVIITFVIARLTLAQVVRPLENLSRAAEKIAAGDLSARAPVVGDSEIAQLGQSFNRMADALAASYAELRERARTDELTALPNFRAFTEVLDGEIERAARYEHTFGVLVLDLDHFKQYNDRFGHAAGNEALQEVAAAIRRSTRAVDFAARYGGEEFSVILPEIDPRGMYAIAERIRVSIQDLPPLAPDRATLTVSIGAALYPVDGLRPQALFEAADARLYEAKAKGRNRVVIASRKAAEAS